MTVGRSGAFGMGAAILAALGLLYAAWPRRTQAGRVYRYKLTIEADTPAGMRRGSVVREIGWQPMWTPTPEAHAERAWQRGEAAVLDLPNGKAVFLLLDREPKDTILAGFHATYGLELGYGAMLEAADKSRAASMFAASDVLRTNHLPVPQLVTFDDPSRPETVRAVDPDHMGASFGEAYTLRRLTIEVTDDAVTESIGHRLPWLERVGRDRATLIPNPPNLLKDAAPIQLIGPSAFSTDLYA